jgi:hypothetical protein
MSFTPLPAYIYRAFPEDDNRPLPNGMRHFEEVAVLVGDAKTRDDQNKLLEQIKRINPRCLADKPYRHQIIPHQARTARATRATNPLRRIKGGAE